MQMPAIHNAFHLWIKQGGNNTAVLEVEIAKVSPYTLMFHTLYTFAVVQEMNVVEIVEPIVEQHKMEHTLNTHLLLAVKPALKFVPVKVLLEITDVPELVEAG